MTTELTEEQLQELIKSIYDTLIAGFNNEGEPLGICDINDCIDAANDIVNNWIIKSKITVIENEN